MMRAIVIVAGVFAFALLTAGCKQKTEAQEPVRPVLSTVVRTDRVERHYSCGHRGTAVQD